MIEWTEGARSVREGYLRRVRRALGGSSVDVDEVLADVRGHIDEVASELPGPVGEADMRAIVERLGAPEDWGEAVPGGVGRGSRAQTGESAPHRWEGWGVLGLTAAGLAAFPWVGPLLLLVAWLAGRAVLARAESAGDVSPSLLWRIGPAVVIGLALVGFLVVIGPVFPLVELAERFAPGYEVLATLGALIGWWMVLAVVGRAASGALRWLVHPLGRLAATGRDAAVVAALLVLGTGAGLPAQAAPDLAGTYEIEARLGGNALTGSFVLWEEGPGMGGQLSLGSLPPAEVTRAVRDGDTVRVDLGFPEGPGRAWWVAVDGGIDGEIQVGPNVVPFTGQRGPAEPAVEDAADALRQAVAERAPAFLEEAGEPGMAVAVVDGDGMWISGFGVADPESGEAVTPETLFQLGSISKTLTAWGVMALVEAGRIDLDRPVGAYLGDWSLPAGDHDPDELTVRRLLSHTAGVNVPSISGVDLDDPVPSLREELAGRGDPARAVRVTGEPGAGYAYSGGGYMVLQLLVEEVTGHDFADYMRKAVLQPLGMHGASFRWTDAVAEHVATPTSPTPERDRRHRLFAGVAGAGLYASASDMAAFLAAHFPGPDGEPTGRGVLSPEAVRTLVTADPVAVRYGLGYEVYPAVEGTPIVGHGGSNVGWKANFILVPDAPLGVVVMSNADEGRARAGVMEIARDVVLRAIGPSPGRLRHRFTEYFIATPSFIRICPDRIRARYMYLRWRHGWTELIEALRGRSRTMRS